MAADNWKISWNDPSFRKQFLLSVLLLVLVLGGFFFVLSFAERRNGAVIERGWLNGIVAPRDFSSWIFSCTYSATLAGITACFLRPSTALLLIRTYLLLQLIRGIFLLLIPLDPPEGIIPLDDPFLHATFYNGRPNLKDLFFSGHVATLVMFIPIVRKTWINYFIAIAAFIAGVLLAWQRVHYMLDVVAAPLFALLAFRLAKWWTSATVS